MNLLSQEADQRTNTQQATLKTELKRITDRLAELDKLVANLYEEYTLGRLQKRNYTKLSEQYQSEQTKLLWVAVVLSYLNTFLILSRLP